MIPEVLMGPFVIGFDPMGYYISTIDILNSGVDIWTFVGTAPGFYVLLNGMVSLGFPIMLAIKALSVILLGLLGLAIFFYANISLLWSSKKSLFVSLLGTLYFVSLRISFDLLRMELALIFLFLTLILLNKSSEEKVGRNSFFLAISMLLVTLSNQIIAVLLFAIILTLIFRSFLKKDRVLIRKLVLISFPAAVSFVVVLFAGVFSSQFSVSSSLIGENVGGSLSSTSLFGFNSHISLVLDTVGFFVLCYLFLLRVKDNQHE